MVAVVLAMELVPAEVYSAVAVALPVVYSDSAVVAADYSHLADYADFLHLAEACSAAEVVLHPAAYSAAVYFDSDLDLDSVCAADLDLVQGDPVQVFVVVAVPVLHQHSH